VSALSSGSRKRSISVNGTTCWAVLPKVMTLIQAVSIAFGLAIRSTFNCRIAVLIASSGAPAEQSTSK